MKNMKNICFLICLLLVTFLKVSAQGTVPISGYVFDNETKEPLSHVHVIMHDSLTGKPNGRYASVSGDDGKFALLAKRGSMLVFSYIGYNSYKYRVKDSINTLKIYLTEAMVNLDEAVIVFNVPKNKSDVTSSNVIVNTKDLAITPVTNVMELLQGRVSGLNIQVNNGMPGAIPQFNVRGISDISLQGEGNDVMLASSSPLIVVDGIPQTYTSDEYDVNGLLTGATVSPLATIPVEDIDNIQILKDAQATSLYGSAGAYGVILIQTKRGSSEDPGKPNVSYSFNFKMNTPPSLRDVAVGNLERQIRMQQIIRNDTSVYNGYNEIHNLPALSDSLNSYWNNNTDWQGLFYRETYNQTHNINVSGGSIQGFNYKINGNYYTEEGIVRNTDFNRYGLSLNMGYKPNSKLELSAQSRITYSLRSTGSGNSFTQQGVAEGAAASSLLPPPSLYTASTATLGVFSIVDDKHSVIYDASLNANYQLPKNVRWSNTLGYSFSSNDAKTFTPGILNSDRAKIVNESSNAYKQYVRSMLSTPTIKLWLLNLGLSAGVEYSSAKSGGSRNVMVGLASDAIKGPASYTSNASSGTSNANASNNSLSFIFNPSFSLGGLKDASNKYVFSPTLRPETNSAYGSKLKWVVNPGLGFRWNAHLESFMEPYREVLTEAALRLTWGRVTTYKATRYDIWGSYNIGDYTYNGISYIPIDLSNLPNPDLKPIVSTQWNAATELNLWRNKLSLTIETYYKQIDNQMRSVELANHTGFTDMKSTSISLVNYGIEVQMGFRPLSTKSNWSLNGVFTMAINRDVITKLPNDARLVILNNNTIVNQLGSNALSNYLYVYKGVYATDADVPVDPVTGKRLHVGDGSKQEQYFRAGDPIWVDVNGDYVIDERDKTIVGNSQPRVTGGLSFNLRYKRFTVSTNSSFILRRDILNKALADRFRAYYAPTSANLSNAGAIVPLNAYDFWTPEHRIAKYPNPYDYTRSSVIDPYRIDQTMFLEDGSYYKLQTLSLSYSCPPRLTSLLRVRTLTVNASMNNIFTFSKYSGVNPENVNSLGYDVSGGYPNSRTFTFGLILSL
jgi:TonB-linked SusC/RagA family outer membrane protein